MPRPSRLAAAARAAATPRRAAPRPRRAEVPCVALTRRGGGTRVRPQTGASTLKLKSVSGKEVANKRTDLQAMLDYFNIDVDNPVNVMGQDAARKFLSAGTARVRPASMSAVCPRALSRAGR